ncbi:hypothetical protein ACFT8P_13645 [Streptomyces sp. NPDC057101]|uniref:hypothetical protein n=1 Tax=Streptomyces sp. NPDC057101 TaxID=3346020 RepID=UPI00363813BD
MLALALLVSACTGTDRVELDAREPTSRYHSPRSDKSAERAHLPIEKYIPSSDEIFDLEKARIIAIEECMKERGVADFHLPDPVHPPNLTERRYGLSDLDEAARFGYEFPEAVTASKRAERRLGEAEQKVLGSDGDPKGCVGIGTAKITGSALRATASSPTAVKIQRDTWLKSAKDARVRAKTLDWSKCMKVKGFILRTPLESPKAGTSKHEERRMATSSVECSATVKLSDVWFEVESELQNVAISKDAVRLEAEKRELQSQLANADSVVKLTGRTGGES